MCNIRENMNRIEIMIRFYIAIFFIVVSVHYNEFLILVLPIIIIYTALKKRCFIYSVFGINENINDEQYYQSLLQVNNQSAMLIFDDNGFLLFENKRAKELFTNIKTLNDLKIPYDLKDYKNDNINVEFNFIFNATNSVYKINIKYLYEQKYILAYYIDCAYSETKQTYE